MSCSGGVMRLAEDSYQAMFYFKGEQHIFFTPSNKAAELMYNFLEIRQAADDRRCSVLLRLNSRIDCLSSSIVLSGRWCDELRNTSFADWVQQVEACTSIVASLEAMNGGHVGQDVIHDAMLYEATALGHIIVVQILLLAIGDPLDSTHQPSIWTPKTPLHTAAGKGHTAVCELLLSRYPATSPDVEVRLPLHLAAEAGNTATCRLLLEAAPATATAGDCCGRLPLHYAAEAGDLVTCQMLIDIAPQAVTAADEDGFLPLHAAANSGETGVCQLLLDRDQHTATAASASGSLPLHMAANNGHTATCQLLLDMAPQTATTGDSDEFLPLHLAALSGHTAACTLLLDRAPNTATAADLDGWLPVHYAAGTGHLAVLDLLLAAAPGAANVADSIGRRPLRIALDNDSERYDAARRLLGCGNGQAVLDDLHGGDFDTICLFADYVLARLPLSAALWERVPPMCPGIGRALPAALAHSTQQAHEVVRRLPKPGARRLRTAALSLHHVQRQSQVFLPADILHNILSHCCL
ncbi:hypothetical protein D9Q98_003588 [Chlorella vulgaris]|uniref:Uncharacterized protein n=1 Tax=Chlorella vulgaris TaxID=3077 RepID=A0A9D4TSW4_CHLVU|nr:hypothetical protein D9Q98_003588 [Chlorella vulgaris]